PSAQSPRTYRHAHLPDAPPSLLLRTFRRPTATTLFPYTTLFRSLHGELRMSELARLENVRVPTTSNAVSVIEDHGLVERLRDATDRKSTRLNSSHVSISYAVFCLKKTKLAQNLTEQ